MSPFWSRITEEDVLADDWFVIGDISEEEENEVQEDGQDDSEDSSNEDESSSVSDIPESEEEDGGTTDETSETSEDNTGNEIDPTIPTEGEDEEDTSGMGSSTTILDPIQEAGDGVQDSGDPQTTIDSGQLSPDPTTEDTGNDPNQPQEIPVPSPTVDEDGDVLATTSPSNP